MEMMGGSLRSWHLLVGSLVKKAARNRVVWIFPRTTLADAVSSSVGS